MIFGKSAVLNESQVRLSRTDDEQREHTAIRGGILYLTISKVKQRDRLRVLRIRKVHKNPEAGRGASKQHLRKTM